MWNLFKTKKIKYEVGSVYKSVTKEGQELRITVIGIDPLANDTAVSIKVFDISEGEEIASHLPFSAKALNESRLTFIENSSDLDFNLDGYNIWKGEFDKRKAGVFTVPVHEVIKSFPSPTISFRRLDNSNLTDFTIKIHKKVVLLGIFNDMGSLASIAPYPEPLELPRIPLLLNEYPFIKLSEITIQDQLISIGYYNYDAQFPGEKLIEPAFGFSANGINIKLYETIRRLRLMPPKMVLELTHNNPVGLNDVIVKF